MKKTLLITIYVFIAQLLTGQPGKENDMASDPFCQMVKTIWSYDAISFRTQHTEKNVFEIDTTTTYAKVLVKKKGMDISFLQIVPETGNQELLFCGDSAWVVSHTDKKMVCIGTNIDDLNHNSMSHFFPFTLYNIDTTITRVEPFWRVIQQTKDYTVISVDIIRSSEELSDIRVEFTVGNAELLPYKAFQESVYLKMDKFFQEQLFTGYSFPDPDEVKVPEYFTTYKKDLGLEQKTDGISESKAEEPLGDIFLHDPELYDLSGNPVSLPDNGLIFIDLWYVGCSPCMKSAPVIERIFTEYKDQVHFFSINETDKDTAKIARFKDKMGITFPVLLGGKEKLAFKVSGTNGYPLFILMDAESRKVLWQVSGYSENLQERIITTIKQFI